MAQLASEQPGYIGMDAARERSTGITVSYWESEQAVAKWKGQLEHQQAQAKGRGTWYRHYTVCVARVERSYSGGGDA